MRAGDAVVIMDADLQHPPEMIEPFVARWREGYVMVYGQRTDRADETRGQARLRPPVLPPVRPLRRDAACRKAPAISGSSTARASRCCAALGEKARFSKGLYAWIGFKTIGVPFVVEERRHGATKWSFRKLFRFAFDGITSFSTVPLRVWTYLGGLISILVDRRRRLLRGPDAAVRHRRAGLP